MLIIALMVQLSLSAVTNGLEEMARGHYVEAAEAFRQVAAELQSVGGDRSLLANALNNEAEACRRSGSDDRAEALYKQAIDLLQNDSSARRQLAATFTNLGTFYRGIGSYERSLESYKQAERIAHKIASPGDPL